MTVKSVDVEESRLLSTTWVGLIQSALRGKKNEAPPVRLVGQKHLHYGGQCTPSEIGVI